MAVYHPRMKALLEILPEDFDAGLDGDVPAYDVSPKSITIENNGFREANKFTLEIDYSDFPFDPRAIRSCRVGLYMQDSGDPRRDVAWSSGEALRFVGFVDEPKTAWSDAGEFVTFTGRDYTGVFLDTKWQDGALVRIDRPFHTVLKEIIATVPGAEDVDMVIPADIAITFLSKIMGRKRWAPPKNADVWTVIVELCQLLGVLPNFELDKLVIRAPDDFGTGSALLLWGHNVSSLEFKRNLTEVRTRQIRVKSWDAAAGAVREGTWPEKPVVVRKRVSTKGKVTNDLASIEVFNVSGSFTSAELRTMAKGIYEEQARQQIEGTLETNELADLIGDDITTLSNGDSLIVQLSKDDPSTFTGLSQAAAVRRLVDGPSRMRPVVARALVVASRKADNLASQFYVQRATHTMDRDNGYSLQIAFINYL